MNSCDVLIIGAGASGLMVARELARAGKKIIVLEARNRIGGRIHTLYETGFSIPLEAGAEFVHGDLPVSLALLQEANLQYLEMEGEPWRVENGIARQSNSASIEEWDVLLEKMNQLTQDMPIQQFLETHFTGDKYKELRESVIHFVEGYDAAEASNVSTLALREEWSEENEATQYRLPGGYSRLMDFLAEECKKQNGEIVLNAVVTNINWKEGQVEVITKNEQHFKATCVVLTLPLGVWQAEPGSTGFVAIEPQIPERRTAFHQMGFGAVIKFLLEFRSPFWEQDSDSIQKMPALGFLFSDAVVPTWWTQSPQKAAVLAGWLAGPKAMAYATQSIDDLRIVALDTLAGIFHCTQAWLREQLIHSEVINWTTDPLTRGAYAYATVETANARKILSEPVHNTLFFAGEALYDGPEMGTVEAALASGQRVARQILQR